MPLFSHGYPVNPRTAFTLLMVWNAPPAPLASESDIAGRTILAGQKLVGVLKDRPWNCSGGK